MKHKNLLQYFFLLQSARLSRVLRLACHVAAAILLASAASAQQRFRVDSHTIGGCCPSRMQFLVTNQETGESKTLSLEARVNEFEEFFIVHEHLLVVQGKLRYGGWIFVIADLIENQQKRVLWTYQYSLAPSRDSIVYSTHYPPHGLPASRRSTLMLHHFDDDITRPFTGSDEEVAEDVHTWGSPVFPEENLFSMVDAVGIAPQWWDDSPYVWAPRGDALAFIVSEKRGNGAMRYLVLLTGLADAHQSPAIWRHRLNEAQFLREDLVGKITPEVSEVARFNNLRWIGPCELLATAPESDYSPFKKEISLALPCLGTGAK